MALTIKSNKTLDSQVNQLNNLIEELSSKISSLRAEYYLQVSQLKQQLSPVFFKKLVIVTLFIIAFCIFNVVFNYIRWVYPGDFFYRLNFGKAFFLLFLYMGLSWLVWDIYWRSKRSFKYPQGEITDLQEKIYEYREELDPITKGAYGENIVAQRREGLPEGYIVINDLILKTETGHSQTDHVVIGPYGIHCIETKHMHGRFYPSSRKWLWYPYESYGRVKTKNSIPSPQLQAEYHAKIIRQLFRQWPPSGSATLNWTEKLVQCYH